LLTCGFAFGWEDAGCTRWVRRVVRGAAGPVPDLGTRREASYVEQVAKSALFWEITR